MNTKIAQLKPSILIRIARILVILFAVFISLFALDVFEEGVPLGQIVVALLIHLIPTYVILIILWASWKRPLIGGILFMLLGLFYILSAHNQAFLAYLLIAGPPFLIGLLFLIGYLLDKRNIPE